jgi:asparagine synthetase B (glutamine-hydrolysing)
VEGYVELFRAAIARRLPDHDDFAVPLSGGRDSRHILLELCAQGRPPRFCITGRRFPPAGSEDERIARLLAAAVGVDHVVVGPPRGQVRSLVAANLKTNLTAPRRGWKLAVAERLRQSVRASYDGIGGDMLSAGAMLDPAVAALVEAGRFHEYARFLFRNFDSALARLVPRATYPLISGEVAAARLETELARHTEAVNPTTSFAFWNRTRRFNATSPYGIYADLPTVYSPFLDHDLYDFLASLPVKLMLDHGLHDEAIRAAYPKYADIPYETPEVPGARSVRRTLATAGELAAFVLRHRPRRLVNTGFVLPRLAAALLSLGCWTTTAWSVPLVVYLTQLESIERAQARTPLGESSGTAPSAHGPGMQGTEGRIPVVGRGRTLHGRSPS